MTTALEAVRSELKQRYLDELGLNLSEGVDEQDSIEQPLWLWLKSDDLGSPQPSSDDCDAGAVLDPDVGNIHLFVTYDPEREIEPVIIRALNHRSKLVLEQGYESTDPKLVDPDGSWRIVIAWLIKDTDLNSWLERIAAVREESSFSEEITFEAIDFSSSDPGQAIREYRFPRLLLTVRKVMGLKQQDQALQWMSADARVAEALAGFSGAFNKPGQKRLARDIERRLEELRTSASGGRETSEHSTQPPSFSLFSIRNVRSIRMLSVDFGTQPIRTSTFFGPNGTGKSSLAEAMSLALFRYSSRYHEFCDVSSDWDLGTGDRSGRYLDQYFRSIDTDNGGASFSMDDAEPRSFEATSKDDVADAQLAAESNFLSQELSIAFTNESPLETAVRVLGNYSNLADSLNGAVKRQKDEAEDRRKAYLGSLGLNAAISKVVTIRERIAATALKSAMPPFPSVLASWLDSLDNLPHVSSLGSSTTLRSWFADERYQKLAKDIVSDGGNRSEIEEYVASWLEDYNGLAARSNRVVAETHKRIRTTSDEQVDLMRDARTWGEWLESTSKDRQKENNQSSDREPGDLPSKQEELKRTRQRGRVLRARQEHLERALVFIRETWREHDNGTCPTCSADYSDSGGIESTVESLLEETTNGVNGAAASVERLVREIGEAQKLAVESGSTDCPIEESRRKVIVEALLWLVDSTSSMEPVLRDPGQREALLASAESIFALPQTIEPIDDMAQVASETAHEIVDAWDSAAEIFAETDNWKVVYEAFSDSLSNVVSSHLPSTIEKLWLEIVFSMTSASWLYRHKLRMKADTHRNIQTLSLETEGRKLRFILNKADAHVLGIAWFFAQYLLRGRYQIRMMLLDDPAQEMDETTFREYCRLVESFVRLHRGKGEELLLVHLLHQEARAIAIARATGSTLQTFSWRSDAGSHLGEASIVDGRLAPRNPLQLFSPNKNARS